MAAVTVRSEGAVRVVTVRATSSAADAARLARRRAPATHLEFVLDVTVAELKVSLVDHTPCELLLLSVDRLAVSMASGLAGGRGNTTDVTVATVQIDDQGPNTAAPVLLWHSSADGEPLLRYTMSELAASSNRDGKARCAGCRDGR